MKFIARLAIIITSTVFANITYAENLIMPMELVELAQKHNYSQLTDYYDNRYGMTGPPFVYGYLEGPIENSAAFWVQKKNSNKNEILMKNGHMIRSILLIMVRDKQHREPKLIDKIELKNPPAGLSIYKDPNTTLEGFVFIEDPKKQVPKNVKLEKNAIRSYHDGVEQIFYNYNGEWLVRLRH